MHWQVDRLQYCRDSTEELSVADPRVLGFRSRGMCYFEFYKDNREDQEAIQQYRDHVKKSIRPMLDWGNILHMEKELHTNA